MLFMKGTPAQPRCGFSRKIIDLLNAQDLKYSTFDIFSDESVRAGAYRIIILCLGRDLINLERGKGLKVYNNWPTFPQLVINGEFVGGLDIVQEMVENGEFQELVNGL
jgi:glutaredoxin-related protein